MKKTLALCFVLVVSISAPAVLRAQTYYWTGATSSDWNTAANWNVAASGSAASTAVLSTAVPTAGQTVDFGIFAASQTNVNISASDTVKNFVFDTSSSSQTFNVTTSGGAVLTVDTASTAAYTPITLRSSGTFNGSMILTDSLSTLITPQIYLNNSDLTFGTSSTLNAVYGFATVPNSTGNMAINGALTIGNSKGITFGSIGVLTYNPTTASVTNANLRVTTAGSSINLDKAFAGGSITLGQYSSTGGAVYLSGTNMTETASISMSSAQSTSGTFTFGSNSASTTTNTQSGAINITTASITTTGLTITDNFDVAANNTLIISGAISGVTGTSGVNQTVTKTGSGTLTLSSNSNTYAAPTNIIAGTLLATNTLNTSSATGTGAVSISSGAILGGTGYITGAVTANAAGSIIAPGTSTATGTLTLSGGLTATNGLTFDITMNGTSATSLLTLNGGFAAATGTLTFNITDLKGTTVAAHTVYTLISGATGTWTSPSSVVFNTLPAGWVLDTSYNGTGYLFNATNDTFTVEFAAVPEPSPVLLIGLSLLVWGAVACRRRLVTGRNA